MKRPDELTAEQEERLARWRAGEMDAAERAAFERDVLGSDALAEAAYREAAFDALAEPAAASAPAPRAAAPKRAGLAWPKLAWRVALPVAATLLAVWMLPHLVGPRRASGPAPGDDLVRGEAAAVRLVVPAGAVDAAPTRFTWTRDPGAESYRVEIFDAEGTRVATAVTRDTTLDAATLPAPAPGAGDWRVVPIAPDGAERAASERVSWAKK